MLGSVHRGARRRMQVGTVAGRPRRRVMTTATGEDVGRPGRNEDRLQRVSRGSCWTAWITGGGEQDANLSFPKWPGNWGCWIRGCGWGDPPLAGLAPTAPCGFFWVLRARTECRRERSKDESPSESGDNELRRGADAEERRRVDADDGEQGNVSNKRAVRVNDDWTSSFEKGKSQ